MGLQARNTHLLVKYAHIIPQGITLNLQLKTISYFFTKVATHIALLATHIAFRRFYGGSGVILHLNRRGKNKPFLFILYFSVEEDYTFILIGLLLIACV